MKFAAHLNDHLTPEWRTQYVAYEDLKDMLYEAQENAPPSDISDEETLKKYYAKFDQKFFSKCEQELNKINMFFAEKLAEAHRKSAALHIELRLAKNHREITSEKTSRISTKLQPAKSKDTRPKISDLKVAYSELYLSLILLQNYQSLNFTGFRKILKKHDKICETQSGAEFRLNEVETAPFSTNKQIERLIRDCEETYIVELEGGDRTRAMKRLRVPPLTEKQVPEKFFFVGLFLGTFITLSIAIILSSNYLTRWFDQGYIEAYITIYRGLFLVVLFVGLLGANLYGWSKYGVNHVLIFGLDPRSHITFEDLLEVSFVLGTLWCCSVLILLFSPIIGIKAYISPFVCVCLFVLILFFPVPIFKKSARFWLLKYLFRVITAPYFFVTFPDFWLADQLNSLRKVILDFEYFVCFYAFELDWKSDGYSDGYENHVCNSDSYGLRTVLSMLPAWFRFAQCLRRYQSTKKCFPHIVNSGKYAVRLVYIGLYTGVKLYYDQFGHHSIAWMSAYVFARLTSTVYSLYWDLKMDWGLFSCSNKDAPCLREEMVYPKRSFYYFGIITNFTIRFMWVTQVVNMLLPFVNSLYLSTFYAIFVVFRRFIWNYFRLENEHLNNCGQFRATRDISIAPMEEDHQTLLCSMMDDPEIVINKRTPVYSKSREALPTSSLRFNGLKRRVDKNKSASRSNMISDDTAQSQV
ncbi:xenotropic and polytropic retrovirus receptor 1 homolog [Symsagittifera roscoffensis]|uniref:xenotropic and polytropic retrovirus receptor 1 homolog n=1 Tax=Symsagittifera roscoffensis TaxID=84072 RepID=UPI00307C97A1